MQAFQHEQSPTMKKKRREGDIEPDVSVVSWVLLSSQRQVFGALQ